MHTIHHTITIAQPLDRVFAYISHYENDVHWRSGVLSMTQSGASAVGVQTREVLHFLGQDYETVGVVSELIPNSRIAFHSTVAQIPVSGWRAVAVCPEGTQLSFSLTMQLQGYMALAAPVLTNVFTRQVRFDLRTLKLLLEGVAVPA